MSQYLFGFCLHEEYIITIQAKLTVCTVCECVQVCACVCRGLLGVIGGDISGILGMFAPVYIFTYQLYLAKLTLM